MDSFRVNFNCRLSCSDPDKNCEQEIRNVMVDTEHEDYKACDCLPECNYISFYYDNFHERFEVENRGALEKHSATSVRFDDDEFVPYTKVTAPLVCCRTSVVCWGFFLAYRCCQSLRQFISSLSGCLTTFSANPSNEIKLCLILRR